MTALALIESSEAIGAKAVKGLRKKGRKYFDQHLRKCVTHRENRCEVEGYRNK